jgi:hypothetical protein
VAEEIRLDAGKLGKAKRTPQGGARIPATLTRTGILEYRRADGTVRKEYRPKDEVFRQDSLDQLLGAPVTVGHVAMIDAANWREHAKGHVIGNIRQDGPRVAADIDVQDADTLKRIDSGDLTEISLGYRVDYDPTPGEFNGERYDGVQRNIRYNHVALLESGKGRAGRDIGLRLDDSSAVCDTPDVIPATKEVTVEPKTVVKIRLDGKEFEEGSKEHIAHLESKASEALKKAETESARADSLQVKLTKSEADLAAANSVERLDSLANARVELRTKAARVLGADYKFQGKSDREIMVDAIRVDRKDFSDKDAAGNLRPDVYVEASFDMIEVKAVRQDSISALTGFLTRVKSKAPEARTDSSEDNRTPRQKMIERNQTAWQKKA